MISLHALEAVWNCGLTTDSTIIETADCSRDFEETVENTTICLPLDRYCDPSGDWFLLEGDIIRSRGAMGVTPQSRLTSIAWYCQVDDASLLIVWSLEASGW